MSNIYNQKKAAESNSTLISTREEEPIDLPSVAGLPPANIFENTTLQLNKNVENDSNSSGDEIQAVDNKNKAIDENNNTENNSIANKNKMEKTTTTSTENDDINKTIATENENNNNNNNNNNIINFNLKRGTSQFLKKAADNIKNVINNDTEKQSNSLDQIPEDGIYRPRTNESSASKSNPLVQATLERTDARDRHVQFQDHIAESAAIVDRMLGATPAINSDAFTQEGDEYLNANPLYTTGQAPQRGGSVLGSLMRLERQQHQQQLHKSSHKKHKFHRSKNKNQMYNIPEHSQSEDNVSANKPKKINNNQSWITNVTKKQHVVPSLDKRKTRSALSSRRSSVDSTLTTASQFEHITLEDRVRITFEIANILQKQTFLRKLADGLMLYGCPAHRLEYIMDTVSKTIAIQADYVTLPNCMLMSFIDPSMHTTETHFLRQPQGFDMDRLGEVYRLEKLVSHGEVTVDEAVEFLDNVSSAPVTYSVWLNPFIYALASFCACVMFYGGNFKEGGISACLAIFFSIYEIFSSRLVSFQPIYEITCCIIIGFIAVGIGNFGYCFTPVAFASFVIILPGYSMTVGLVEIVSRQLVSGVVRMVYAILYAFLLGYGITFGASIYNAIDPTILEGQKDTCQRAFTSGTCVTTESSWYYFLTVPLFAISYCGYLKASPSRWPFMIVISAIGFVVNWALSCQVAYPGAPNQVIQVVPAFAVGLVGNLYTKATGKMSFDGVLLAVFYLVPGGLGLKAALGLFGGTDDINQYSSQGSAFALSMIETAIGISVGLFIATLIVYPKGSQHTPLMNF